MTPKLSQNQISDLIGNIENESCSTARVDHKTVVEPYPNPQNSSLGPKKVKNYPKIKQKQISEFTETYKIKVVQLYE